MFKSFHLNLAMNNKRRGRENGIGMDEKKAEMTKSTTTAGGEAAKCGICIVSLSYPYPATAAGLRYSYL